MNKNLKKIMIAGASLLMVTSIGALTHSANASHNIGWRVVNHNINLKSSKRGKLIHLRKNQKVYVIKLIPNKKSAQVKIGRKYYDLNTELLKRINYRKTIKKYKKDNNKLNKQHAKKSNKKNKRNAKRLAKKAHFVRKNSHKKLNKKNARILKSKFKRSNNPKLLKHSGFIDLRAYGPDIMNKYAPNNRKAVIPKNVDYKNVLWFQGHLMQKNPTAYQFNIQKNGWVKLNK